MACRIVSGLDGTMEPYYPTRGSKQRSARNLIELHHSALCKVNGRNMEVAVNDLFCPVSMVLSCNPGVRYSLYEYNAPLL
jgi:hypothetical protein